MVVLLVSLLTPLLFESRYTPTTVLLKSESRGNFVSFSRSTKRVTALLKWCPQKYTSHYSVSPPSFRAFTLRVNLRSRKHLVFDHQTPQVPPFLIYANFIPLDSQIS